jgi:hypothetical protein
MERIYTIVDPKTETPVLAFPRFQDPHAAILFCQDHVYDKAPYVRLDVVRNDGRRIAQVSL